MEFFVSRKRIAWRIAIIVLFLCAAINVLIIGSTFYIIAGLILLFIAIRALFVQTNILTRAAREVPALMLDERGIRSGFYDLDLPWEAIQSVSTEIVASRTLFGRITLLCIRLNPGIHRRLQYAKPLSRPNEWIRGKDRSSKNAETRIAFDLLEPGVEAAMRYVRRVRPSLVQQNESVEAFTD